MYKIIKRGKVFRYVLLGIRAGDWGNDLSFPGV
jgi:hypothetical protein